MESLELRHLRTLCAIADTGSLRRAGTLQGYSQPAVTTQLQRTERFFGEPLFERSSTGAVPTPFGAEVVARARDVLSRMDAIGRRAARAADGGGENGRVLRLAVTNSDEVVALVVLPDTMLI